MSKFFINRPIVAMVISIMFVILGLVAMAGLPVAQFPEIVPPEVQILTTYTGADAETVEQSVATPIEQQMSGVDNMNYMYSVNASNGTMRMFVNFDVKTDPNTDLVLSQIRQNLAQPQLPVDVRNYGVTMQKARSSPLMLIALYSPKGTYDSTFLANYANINLIDPLLRVPGIAMINVFGAGQYAIRIWVKPDTLGKLGITVPDIVNAVQKQNTVNPAGQIGSEPVPPGQEFTYTVRAQSRLVSPEEFGSIVIRANSDGSIVRLKDVARIELGAQTYNIVGRVDGEPAGRPRPLPVARHERAQDRGGREKGYGAGQEAVSRRRRLCRRPRYHEIDQRRHPRDPHHAPGGPRPRHTRGLHLPSGMEGDPYPGPCRARLPHRHLCRLPPPRVFDQYPLALRPGAGHRTGRG